MQGFQYFGIVVLVRKIFDWFEKKIIKKFIIFVDNYLIQTNLLLRNIILKIKFKKWKDDKKNWSFQRSFYWPIK